ncbi:MAG: helix-turn-helix transcriptional regulator [Acidimicrobiales bacterium]|nr:helix-turn-helix transcriptional regulator [Acidimicrobiales bacterium]
MPRAPIGLDAQLRTIIRSVRDGYSVLVTGGPGSGVSTLLAAFVDAHLSNGGTIAQSPEVSGATSGTVLVLDDVDLVDPESASRMRTLLLARQLVAVFGTTSPRSASVARLTSSARVSEIQLESLDPDRIAEIVVVIAGAYPDRPTALWLEAFSGGRLGILVPTIDHAVANRALTIEGGLARLREPLSAPLSVVHRIECRRAALSDDAKDAVTAICVARHLPVDSALRAFGSSVLAEAEQSGLLAVRHDSAQHIVEPTFGAVHQVVLDELGYFGIATTAQSLLERLPDAPFAQRIHWQLLAGQRPAGDDLIAAAIQTSTREELHVAAELATAAWESGHAAAGSLLAALIAARGDRPGAARILEQVLANPNLDPEDYARAALELATIRLWNLGDADGAIELATLLREALCRAGHELAGAAALGGILLYAGQPKLALETLCWPGVCDELDDELACQVLGTALAVTGACTRAVTIARRGLDLTLAQSPPRAGLEPEIHVLTIALALEHAGELEEANMLISEWYDRAARRSVHHGWLNLARMRIALARGDLTVARRSADEAAAVFRDTDNQVPRRWAVAGKLFACALAGDSTASEATSKELDLLATGAVRFLEPDVFRALAWYAALRGRVLEARELLGRACDIAREAGLYALESSALHDLVRLGEAKGALPRLEFIEAFVDSPWSTARVLQARGVVDNDPEPLLAASNNFGAHGALLWAAEAAAQAVAACENNRSQTARREATAILRSWYERGIHAATPALLNARLASLSKREREVARLATAGQTSREIATQLSVSVRTVENHLQSIYVKLGMRSRAELRDWLVDNSNYVPRVSE